MARPTDPKPLEVRTATLEAALARIALALHMQHLTPGGASWDECPNPLCAEARRLLPALRLGASHRPVLG